jgi:hypothetical protein
VLAGGGAIAALLLELLELELLDELEPHGSIATVCVSVLRGITISFEPGGIALLPDWATDASEHDSTARVSGLCCFGMTTVLTPGFCRAVATGSELELLLLPQPVIAATAAHITVTATTRFAAERELLMVSSVGWPGYKPIVFLDAPQCALRRLLRSGPTPAPLRFNVSGNRQLGEPPHRFADHLALGVEAVSLGIRDLDVDRDQRSRSVRHEVPVEAKI